MISMIYLLDERLILSDEVASIILATKKADALVYGRLISVSFDQTAQTAWLRLYEKEK